MTTVVSPARPSVRRRLSIPPRAALTFLSDRVVLAAVFVVLFCLNYAPHLFDAFTNIFAVDNDLDHSRTVSSAEILGFVAIAVVLRDLHADRVLRRGDFIAIAGITIASLYPSPAVCAIAMTCLGLLFVARSDKRIASLGQLSIGLVWIDYWALSFSTSSNRGCCRLRRELHSFPCRYPDRFRLMEP
jgi:cytochrome c oxidase assembly factor CtaG